eukprot:scaffold1318_cov362-Pavlova_lutheri.AAC.20
MQLVWMLSCAWNGRLGSLLGMGRSIDGMGSGGCDPSSLPSSIQGEKVRFPPFHPIVTRSVLPFPVVLFPVQVWTGPIGERMGTRG